MPICRNNKADDVCQTPLVLFYTLYKNSAFFVFAERCLFKGTYRDHRVTGALNFHKTRDFCILVMVLDVYELNPERNRENMPPFYHKTALNSNV